MFGYYVRLATRSISRTPALTALMILAMAFGIGACVVMVTIYHVMSGNPIWWKDDRLHAITLDSWDVNEPADKARPQFPPMQLTYRDVSFLRDTALPGPRALMYLARGVLSGGSKSAPPISVETRFTTADLFPMFEVPFLYGGAWSAPEDRSSAPVIVLSRDSNDRLFAGANSVGKTVRWNDQEFRILGVLDRWEPQPKFYDLNRGAYNVPEGAFIPLQWGVDHQVKSAAGRCWKAEKLDSYQAILGSECIWLQGWVELDGQDERARMQSLLDAYTTEQRKTGRFERPLNNRLTRVSQWLDDNQVVRGDNRTLLGLAFAFLAVCLLNTVGVLMAKFLNRAPSIGVRRALGATRGEIMAQHLVEVGVLTAAGALLGLALGALGLWGLRALYTLDAATRGGFREVSHFDLASVYAAIALSVLSTLVAGLYPAWRMGRIAPASYLKSL
jgi:putative ABC transport system permease protein